MQNARNVEAFLQLTQQTIYLMGISFILGSLVTIFCLLILDMVRCARLEQMETLEKQRPQPGDDKDTDQDAA